jgi:hypothetical protein
MQMFLLLLLLLVPLLLVHLLLVRSVRHMINRQKTVSSAVYLVSVGGGIVLGSERPQYCYVPFLFHRTAMPYFPTGTSFYE